MAQRPKIGIALGAGGARGWGHIGVLRALEAAGLAPDVVAGCSMGALVGAAWAGGRLSELEAWARDLTTAGFLRLLDLRLSSGGLIEAREIETVLRDIGVADRIEALAKPFTAIATDMETGRELWLNKGPTFPAVRGSVALPGIFSPLFHDGRWLLDGGLVNPVPVSAVRAMGADIILAVNPNARPGGQFWREPPQTRVPGAWAASVLPEGLRSKLEAQAENEPKRMHPSYIDVVTAAIDVMANQIIRSRLAGEPPDVLINLEFDDMTILEIYRAGEAIEEGQTRTEAKIPELRTAVERLSG